MSDFTLSKRSNDHWFTPPMLYQSLNAEFNFDDDPCPLHGDGVEDGLKRDWGKSVFMNPPYSNPGPWVKKAYEESLKGKVVVGLLRGDTSAAWFHDWVWHKAEIRFIRGRVKFGNQDGPAPFASIIAIWGGRHVEDSVSVKLSRRTEMNVMSREYKKQWAETHKESVRKSRRKWREKNRERASAAINDWRKRHPEMVLEYAKRHRIKFPERELAVKTLNNSLRNKKITKASLCEICTRNIKTEAHHPDYSRPLSVIWLCHECHINIHSERCHA